MVEGLSERWKNSEKKLYQPNIWEIGIPLANETIVVRLELDQLRKDFYIAAINQNVNEQTAKLVADQMTLHIGREAINQRLSEENQINGSIFSQKINIISGVSYSSDIQNLELFFDPEKIIKLFFKKKQFNSRVKFSQKHNFYLDFESLHSLINTGSANTPRSHWPKDIPVRYRQILIQQLLDAMWRHERQHLIQQLKPEKRKNMENEMNKNLKIQKLVRAAFVGGIAGMFLTLFKFDFLNHFRQSISIFLSAFVSGSYLVSNYANRQLALNSQHELEAYSLVSEKSHRESSPFTVIIENP